jgi:hypothetical protein
LISSIDKQVEFKNLAKIPIVDGFSGSDWWPARGNEPGQIFEQK